MAAIQAVALLCQVHMPAARECQYVGKYIWTSYDLRFLQRASTLYEAHTIRLTQQPRCRSQPVATYNQRDPPPRPMTCGAGPGGDGSVCPGMAVPRDPPLRMPVPATAPPRWQSAFGPMIHSSAECIECADRQLVSDLQVGDTHPLRDTYKTSCVTPPRPCLYRRTSDL